MCALVTGVQTGALPVGQRRGDDGRQAHVPGAGRERLHRRGLTVRTRGPHWIAALALLLASAAAAQVDSKNPSCPTRPDWGPTSPMQFTARKEGAKTLLLAEGAIDAALRSEERRVGNECVRTSSSRWSPYQ